MHTRAAGEGTVFQRADGRWAAQARIGEKRRTVYGRTKAEAVAKLAELRQTSQHAGEASATQ